MIIKETNINEYDLATISTIWLESNIDAHDFIKKSYWKSHFDMVKEQLPTSDLYLYRDYEIKGFIGLLEDHIAGIFVKVDEVGNGIGSQLLNVAKTERNQLFFICL